MKEDLVISIMPLVSQQTNQPIYLNQGRHTMAQADIRSNSVKASPFLLFAGYFFALLGGLIGIGIGAYIRNTRMDSPGPEKVFKFDAKARAHGLTIIIISAVSMAIGIGIQFAMI